MAKKKETKVEVEEPQVEETVVMEEPVVEPPKKEIPKRKEPTYKKAEDGWEIKDRIYRLVDNKKPLSRMIKSADL